MGIEGFNYQEFAQTLTGQVNELVPGGFEPFQKEYIVNTVRNFATLCGEAIDNDASLSFNADQAMLITQIIAEWSFHKSIDLIKAGIQPDYWDGIMQKIAFTIFEVAKQTLTDGMPQEDVLQIVEENVKKAYSEALEELKNQNAIDESIYDKAAHQSNIDEMMEQIQHDKEEAERNATLEPRNTQQESVANSKILKLASVALLLKQVSQDKVRTILNKFDPGDAEAVIEYMQIKDLDQKLDRNIAIKCLHEIKTNLPEPKMINPTKILSRCRNIFENNDKTKVEKLVIKERASVKDFITQAYDGEYSGIPTKVANIIAQHLEESL